MRVKFIKWDTMFLHSVQVWAPRPKYPSLDFPVFKLADVKADPLCEPRLTLNWFNDIGVTLQEGQHYPSHQAWRQSLGQNKLYSIFKIPKPTCSRDVFVEQLQNAYSRLSPLLIFKLCHEAYDEQR